MSVCDQYTLSNARRIKLTTSEGLKWLYDKAISLGYDHQVLNSYRQEIRWIIEEMEAFDEEQLEEIFNNYF